VRIALFVGHQSYRARAFLDATRSLGVDAVVVTDRRSAIESPGVVHVDQLEHLVDIDGVVAADDWGVPFAARLAERLGLPGNTPDAVTATLDKRVLRDRLVAGGLRQPTLNGSGGPWIVKPVDRSAGEGVVLVQTASSRDEAAAACRVRYGHEPLVESFVAGPEVVIEAMSVDGRFHVVASFDKPGERIGPTFPETMLVSPSIHEPEASAAAARACAVLKLPHGPVHVEVVMGDDGPVVLEVHARSIGGMCSAAVACDPPLEQIIVLGALGRLSAIARRPGSVGVYMVPVPRAGTLLAVDGVVEAEAVPGITGVDITAVGRTLATLPDRGEYVGFVYAAAPRPDEVERALADAVGKLSYRFVGA
jgi:predicted ATP-grasp superfamily ATP-dependent carboligase